MTCPVPGDDACTDMTPCGGCKGVAAGRSWSCDVRTVTAYETYCSCGWSAVFQDQRAADRSADGHDEWHENGLAWSANASVPPDLCEPGNVGEHAACTPPCGCTSSRHESDHGSSHAAAMPHPSASGGAS